MNDLRSIPSMFANRLSCIVESYDIHCIILCSNGMIAQRSNLLGYQVITHGLMWINGSPWFIKEHCRPYLHRLANPTLTEIKKVIVNYIQKIWDILIHRMPSLNYHSPNQYSDVIVTAMASQITGVPILISTVVTHQRKYQKLRVTGFDRWIPLTNGQ